MPLYIKLDLTKDGRVHAWISDRGDSFAGFHSTAWGNSVAEALRQLAKKLPEASK